jgi:hypothetical protein
MHEGSVADAAEPFFGAVIAFFDYAPFGRAQDEAQRAI